MPTASDTELQEKDITLRSEQFQEEAQGRCRLAPKPGSRSYLLPVISKTLNEIRNNLLSVVVLSVIFAG